MIALHADQTTLAPGEELRFEFVLSNIDLDTVTAIETSVVWYTEGKGNEDLGVHFFQRLTGDAITDRVIEVPQPLTTILPASPLSYDGRLLKIRWCIRVRVYLDDGEEMVAQQPFVLK
jgi:hypothetical protein